QLSRDDDRLTQAKTIFNNTALDNWQFLHRTFDSQIAARDHDHIRALDHLVYGSHRQLVLDLCHDLRLALFPRQEFSQLFDVAFLAHETQSDEIRAYVHAEGDIRQVLPSERGKIHVHAGQINMTPRTENRARQHLAAHPISSLVKDKQFDQTIIDQNRIPKCHVVGKAAIIHVHRIAFFTLCSVHGELQNVAGLQMQISLQVAGPDSRALGVKEKRSRSIRFLRQHPDAWNDVAAPVVAGVAHVQSKDVSSFLN